MRKITRTIKKDTVEITVYLYDSMQLEKVYECVYEMSDKELLKYFEKKYSAVGKIVDVKIIDTENIKASMDIETFVSLATVTPAVNEEPEMPEPIVYKE